MTDAPNAIHMLSTEQRRSACLALMILCALTACTGASAAHGQPSGGASAGDVPRFLTQLDSLRIAKRIPGLSVAVVRNQELVLAVGLGLASVEARVPATAETPYDIASVAKPLSAVVALRLAESGVLDLDRPMAAYSDWAEFCREFSEQPSIFARGLRCQPPAHTLRHLLSHTATSQPGTQFSYNPVLYSWASRPIAAAAASPFSALVDRYVFGPAGMTHSARKHRDLPLPDELARRVAPPYRDGSAGEVERSPAPSPQGDGAAGGVVSTVLDLAKFDVALDRGMLVSAEARATMMRGVRTDDGVTLPYGLGWYVQEYEGRTLVWHSGWWDDAYSALYLKIPALELTFIVLANNEGVWWDNPYERAEVHRSEFVQAFLDAFVRD